MDWSIPTKKLCNTQLYVDMVHRIIIKQLYRCSKFSKLEMYLCLLCILPNLINGSGISLFDDECDHLVADGHFQTHPSLKAC